MRKKLFKGIIASFLVLAVIFVYNLVSAADVGNFESYDSGSDWGGSWDSCSSWSSYDDENTKVLLIRKN